MYLNISQKTPWFASTSKILNFWKNKRVWITGASSGIGKAVAESLAQKGAHLVLSSRRESVLADLVKSLPGNEHHTIFPLDVSNPQELAKKLTEKQELVGAIDVLVNNAGISQRALTWEATPESERLLMETNFFGAVAAARAVLPGMMKRNNGSIAILSSPAGKFGFPLRSSYAASKHALHGYFESLQAELKDHEIKISFICPGRVQTDISKNALKGDGSKAMAMDERLARGITAEECANVIIKALEKGTPEVYLGREQVLIYLHRYAPWLFRRIVKRIKPN